jgi:hypothetical protein
MADPDAPEPAHDADAPRADDAAGASKPQADEPASAEPGSADDPVASAPPAVLSRKARWLRGAATAFTIYHLTAVLLGGAVPSFRRHFAPAFAFYQDGLKMTNSWGMFGKPPLTDNVLIEAEKKDGTKVIVSTTRASDRTLFERVRDVRIRKIQAKLGEAGDRSRIGMSYLDYFCRKARADMGDEIRGMRAIEIVHELRDDNGNVIRRPSQKTVLTRWCGDKTRPVIKPAPKTPFWMKPPDETTKDGPVGEGDS